MNMLTLFGLFAVTAMLVTYALESRSTWFILAFAGSCALGSAYGFLQGAWPFGVVEAIWSVVAVRRWYRARQGKCGAGGLARELYPRLEKRRIRAFNAALHFTEYATIVRPRRPRVFSSFSSSFASTSSGSTTISQAAICSSVAP